MGCENAEEMSTLYFCGGCWEIIAAASLEIWNNTFETIKSCDCLYQDLIFYLDFPAKTASDVMCKECFIEYIGVYWYKKLMEKATLKK